MRSILIATADVHRIAQRARLRKPAARVLSEVLLLGQAWSRHVTHLAARSRILKVPNISVSGSLGHLFHTRVVVSHSDLPLLFQCLIGFFLLLVVLELLLLFEVYLLRELERLLHLLPQLV